MWASYPWVLQNRLLRHYPRLQLQPQEGSKTAHSEMAPENAKHTTIVTHKSTPRNGPKELKSGVQTKALIR
jgi:hypothetical protein